MGPIFRVGEAIEFRFRCNGDPLVENPTAVIYDEVDGVFATLTLGAGLTQVGGSRTLKGTFTPDVAGEWQVTATDDTGLEIIQHYPVGQYSLTSVGAQVASVDAKIDAQNLVLAANHAEVMAAINALGNLIGGGGGHFG